jgi:hypothetical protein
MVAAFHDELEKVAGVKRTARLYKALSSGRAMDTAERHLEQLGEAFGRGIQRAVDRGHIPEATSAVNRYNRLERAAEGFGAPRPISTALYDLEAAEARVSDALYDLERKLRLASLRRRPVKSPRSHLMEHLTSPIPSRGEFRPTALGRMTNPRFLAEA